MSLTYSSYQDALKGMPDNARWDKSVVDNEGHNFNYRYQYLILSKLEEDEVVQSLINSYNWKDSYGDGRIRFYYPKHIGNFDIFNIAWIEEWAQKNNKKKVLKFFEMKAFW